MKKILAIVMVLLLAVSLVGCGGDDNLGQYALKNASVNGVEVSLDKLAPFIQQFIGEQVDLEGGYVVLKDGGSAEINLIGEFTEQCSYKIEGDKITFGYEGQELGGTIKEGKMTVDFMGLVTLNLEK